MDERKGEGGVAGDLMDEREDDREGERGAGGARERVCNPGKIFVGTDKVPVHILPS
jgi:hypothetical protein